MKKEIVVSLIIFSVLSLVHLFNWEGYAPMLAITFFAGALGLSFRQSVLVSLAGLLMGDILVSFKFDSSYTDYFFKGEFLANYALYILSAFIGFKYSKNFNYTNILSGNVINILLFFVLSNLMVWISGLDINSQPYTKDFEGFINCYTAALPFLLKSFVGNGIAAIILYYSVVKYTDSLKTIK